MKAKAYIVTETNYKSNIVLRTWICLTEEDAAKCLKKRYSIASAYNRRGGMKEPTDCLEYGFFFWHEQTCKYTISEAAMFTAE